MKMSFTAVIVFMLFLVVAVSGCGSIYICANTHTHFYDNEAIDTDETNVDGFAKFVKFMKDRMNAEAEPMKDFKWTDKKDKKEESEF
ncbi:MAG: hypothetical protein PHR77_00100 [Kiritimatiellae bacterium]|nr:hypothetical protein [Kiritimatiellia bacterium]MDD5519227.1 hypothetical protein [Kiritimatiellia bacterium]